MTSIDERTIAGSLNEKREAIIYNILNNNSVSDAHITESFTTSPDKIRALRGIAISRFGPGTTFTRKGGLNAHYDYIALDSSGIEHRIELKYSKDPLSTKEITALPSRPWSIAVQFLQGQLQSKLANQLLGCCGTPMMSKWFTEVIVPFILKYSDELPDICQEITENDYMKAMYDINAKNKGDKTAGYAFINSLRENKTMSTEIKTKWKNFQNKYLRAFKPETDDIFTVAKEVIDVKDWWICITQDDARLIEGLVVNDVTFKESKLLRDSRVLLYEMSVTTKSGSETNIVPLELRFHWKNGGQGVQNINFLLK
jgi:hypothetical protein